MSLDVDAVRKIAFLARLSVEKEDLTLLKDDLNNILDWVEQLSEVDTDGVEPLTNISGAKLPVRLDKVSDGGCSDEILINAPLVKENFFTVPKVIE